MAKRLSFFYIGVFFAFLFSSMGFAQLPPPARGQEYLSRFRRYEQTMNDKVENTKVFASILGADILPQYRPESEAAFPLETFWVPESEVVVLNTAGRIPDPRLVRDTPAGRFYLFFVHPVSAKAFAPFVKNYAVADNYSATPLSSYRSLLVWDGNPNDTDQKKIMNLKVSLDAEIGRSRRMLWRGQLEQAAVTSMALKLADMKKYNSQGVYFIDEPFSVYLKNFENGYTWRETPNLQEGAQLVPMFSLYAKNGLKESMLEKMLRQTSMNKREFLREKIMRPLIHHMMLFAFEDGLVAEPHEQNVLVEVKDGMLTGRFFYRDLAGFNINPELRRSAGKNMNFLPPSFDLNNLHPERANLIHNLQVYLLHSNFFAMQAAADSSSITSSWVDAEVFRMVQEEIQQYTGYKVSTWDTAKMAVTRYGNSRLCRRVFAH